MATHRHTRSGGNLRASRWCGPVLHSRPGRPQRHVRAVAAAIAAALLYWSSPAAAPRQPPASPPPAPPPQAAQPAPPQTGDQRPTFRTEANFVRVDVYPTRDGKPVLDLTAADFTIAEDGTPQKVESFEHVVVRPAGPQSERIEPSSVREMEQAAANPRHRVFVIFLDGPHVNVAGSHDIAEPLIRLINRILGPDDLVGIMTPRMSAAQVVLARRTEVTEEQLRKHWIWGERFGLMRTSVKTPTWPATRRSASRAPSPPGARADRAQARARDARGAAGSRSPPALASARSARPS